MSTAAGTTSNGPLSASGDGASTAARGKATGEAGQMAADKMDDMRASAAGGLESTASAIREKAEGLPGGKSVRRAAHVTADALNSTADYVRARDMKGMLKDVQTLAKDNPGPALLIAAGLGFLLARAFSRD
jgi:hypothetical protein